MDEGVGPSSRKRVAFTSNHAAQLDKPDGPHAHIRASLLEPKRAYGSRARLRSAGLARLGTGANIIKRDADNRQDSGGGEAGHAWPHRWASHAECIKGHCKVGTAFRVLTEWPALCCALCSG